jgi:hypothetical protein
MNTTYQIESTHTTLTSAIEAAGGLNREFNPSEFDKEIRRVEKGAAKSEFYVIDHHGRKTVVYHFAADIKLLNAFSPYGATLSSDTLVGYLEGKTIRITKCVENSNSNRKKIREIQAHNEDFFVINF